ncbi:MAG: ung [Haloplasmataceae bacterium]|jgi:uracil-DNA glycosylase|nr:ung [Haloplasmataceae bacterium]
MFNNQWDILLSDEIKKPYFKELLSYIKKECKNYIVYPKYEDIFNALKLTSFQDVKVVIIGQDPYHNQNQAHGLAFSVPKDEKIPKSLQNIFIELKNDLNLSYPQHGNLENWAEQGVLLLNTVLTVRENQPGSHRNLGWEVFSDKIITILNDRNVPIVYVLWGKDAEKKESLINNPIHLILKSSHPSPLSAYRGFLGCKHFSKINNFLLKNNIDPINWKIE